MAERAIHRQEIRISEGVSTAILLALLLASVTGSIDAGNWTDGLGILTWAALIGLTFGILLAKLPVRGLVAHTAMLVFGVGVTVSLVTLLLPAVLTFKEKLIVLQERVLVWFSKVASGKEGSDSLIFVIELTFVLWGIGYLAAWFVYRRHQVWGAIIPPGIAILINLFYAAPQTGLYLGLYILSALLLLVRLNLHALERWWRGAAIGYASDISFDFLYYGAIFAVMLMLLTWLLPASAPGPAWFSFLEPLQEPWQKVEDQFTRVFNTLRAVARPSESAFFGTTLMMGGPVQLGQRPVMDIKADTGRYWRATVYDKYTGIGWISTHLDTLDLPANDARVEGSSYFLRADITETFKIYLPDQNILYAAAQPVEFSLPTEIRYSQPPASASDAAGIDLALVQARRPLRAGGTYAVISAISVADEDSLRADSIMYTDWISATYLQLPDNLPERVRNLAKQITEEYTNPYDKAAAIETYLRKKIKYNDNVSAPPAGRDGVDYTLFDRPEGYCNYYASAMVVLARAVGIPARVASGYTLGEYADGAFHVIESNAHSWPEIFFPNYGWIEFEPTANKPEIDRPKKPETSPTDSNAQDLAQQRRRKQLEKDLEDAGNTPGDAPLLPFGDAFWADPKNLAIAGGSLLALLFVGTIGLRQWQRSRRLGHLAPAAHVYEDLLNRARWLGVREQKHATPYERAEAIGAALPQARREVARIASLYARERFGAQQLNAAESAALSTGWSRIAAEWRRALAVRIIDRIVTPPRRLIERARVRIGSSPRSE
ncbi:MAG: transglutaminase domain-containing protein [Chloroflexota bacterium]|nr:transglutaminase domain-containing protein [Chloroflexota bacterium]